MLNTVKSMLILFLAQACVGTGIVVSKGLIDHINPCIILTIRFSFASIFMLLMLISSKENNKFKLTLTITEGWVLLACGLGAGILFNLIMLSGLHFTSANSAGLITSLLPAIVIALNIMFFKQKLNRKIIVSIAISVAGLILINLSTINGKANNALMGNFLVLLSLIPEGLYYALSKYYPLRMHPILKVLLLNALNLPFLYFIVAFLPASYWNIITLHDWLMMSIIGLTSGLFFVFWQKGIQHIDAAYAALSTAFMPLATVILAWVILGETLSLSKFIGMLLVIISIVSYAKK